VTTIPESATTKVQLEHGHPQYFKVAFANATDMWTSMTLKLTAKPERFKGRVFACASSTTVGLLAEEMWTCAEVTTKSATFDVAPAEDAYILMHVSFHVMAAFSFSVAVDHVSQPPRPPRIGESEPAAMVALVIGALDLVSIVVIFIACRSIGGRYQPVPEQEDEEVEV
jgi:hypothetical protein